MSHTCYIAPAGNLCFLNEIYVCPAAMYYLTSVSMIGAESSKCYILRGRLHGEQYISQKLWQNKEAQ